MKKIIYSKFIYRILFSCLAAILILMPACKKDTNAPVITDVRNYAPTPGDSLLQKMIPGQWVVISGHNLKDAVQIFFDGIPASFNTALFSDTYAVVELPSVIPFPSVSADKLNTIEYVTSGGKTTFTFNIVAPAPTITGVSNENANEGDYVYIFGTNLFFINNISFAGTPIVSYTLSNDGTSVGFVLPALTKSGKVVIDAQSGSDSTMYNVNDVATGALCNFDDVSPIGWGGSAATIGSSNTDFPGNRGKYAILQNGIVNPWDWNAWGGGRIIYLDPVQWVPVENINDPLDNWAVKFEINVPKPWNGNTLFVSSEHNDYRFRYEPWMNTDGKTSSFTTNGWRTITVPLSVFRKDWGRKELTTSIADLIGVTGNNNFCIQTMNIGDGPSVTGLNAAVDNIRVVKIK
jgi:hypothetical protein